MGIKVTDLNKKLGSFELKKINLQIPSGYICGLIGENGAGKTTLLKIMMGLYGLDSGSVRLEEKDLWNQEKEVKNNLGIVMEECLYEDYLTVEGLGTGYGSCYSDFSMEEYKKYVEEFGLTLKQKIKKLSKGMKIKLQFAFALSYHPTVYLMDEPTANLDEEFRKCFWEICSTELEKGATILISSHLTEDLDKKADYIAYLKNGELLFCKDRESLQESFLLVKGENYQLRNLPKDKVISREEGAFGGSALILPWKSDKLKEYEIESPNLRQLMYYLSKGEKENGTIAMEKIRER